jgi:hypothetical protein
VLIGNAIEWLARPDSGVSVQPGPRAFPGSTTHVTGPDGAAVPLVRNATSAFATLDRPGLYLARVGGGRTVVAVNAGDREASNLLSARLEQPTGTPPERPSAGSAWWVLGVLAAFALLSIEWWTWQRRLTV